MFNEQLKKIIVFAAIALFLILKMYSQNDTANVRLVINEWLAAGPVKVSLPAFNSQKNLKGKTFEVSGLLKFNQKEISSVSTGDVFLQDSEQAIIWEKKSVQKDGQLVINPLSNSYFELNWQAIYVEVDQFTEFKIEVQSPQFFELYVDNKKELSKYDYTSVTKEATKKSTNLKLETGKHLLVIKSLYVSDSTAEWVINTSLSATKKKNGQGIRITTSSIQSMDIDHLLLGKRLQSVSLSPDGGYFLSRFSETSRPDGNTIHWFEIKNVSNEKIIFSSKHSELSNVSWAPSGNRVSYKTRTKDHSSLFVLDLDTFNEKTLLKDQKDLSSYTWSNDGKFIIYSIREKPDKNKTGLKRVDGMPDRWPWWQMRSQLYRLNISDLSSQQITFGHLNNNLQDLSPDNKKILISQTKAEFSERPYSKQILIEINLEDLSVDTIWTNNFGGSVSYSPDGKDLLVTGSPAMFGDIGTNLPEGAIPNDYDTQAYIYNLQSGEVKAITKNFNPKIQYVYWNPLDGKIYFIVQERTYQKIYAFDIKNETFTDLKVEHDVVENFSFAKSKPIMVYTGTSISSPETALILDLDKNKQILIEYPEKEDFANIDFGNTEDWDFNNKEGTKIEGRIYYPPNFDPNKKYPLIVYYYSGTNPTDRTFRGRYPKNLYAAMGYVVYNLQPSGATGYGQEFSAAHVNNWGITVADEIIDGTKLFMENHSFIDPEKVGCIGASYGGFMTMLLTTRTDIFSAAIAHAGISSLSSYWGQGYWGYLYSSVASANSFPWNNKDLYINQSPLFSADKVNTPLLLLTGNSDTNVPPGESIQMYTALKLLGKTVELIEVEGQNHHILDYKKRVLWQKTIFAWFDKYLKGQEGWWNELYPEKNQ